MPATTAAAPVHLIDMAAPAKDSLFLGTPTLCGKRVKRTGSLAFGQYARPTCPRCNAKALAAVLGATVAA